MKKLLSACLAVLMTAALLPTAVSAASDFEKTYFPCGISTPKAAYLVYEYNDANSDSIEMWYNPSEELRALEDAYEIYRSADKTKEEYFGVYEYTVGMQVDAKIDDGAWISGAEWDDLEWRGLDEPTDLAFRTFIHPDASGLYSVFELSWLIYLEEGRLGFLEPIVYAVPNEYGENRYHYDLGGHTLSVRYRYFVDIYPEYDRLDRVFSEWSPVTSIGKNGNQVQHTAPTALEAPRLSGFEVSVSEDGGRSGRYFIHIPDSVFDALLYCEADLDAFGPLYIQAQMRLNGTEWQDVYTANPNWIYDGYRSAAPADEELKADDAVEIRACIVCETLGIVSPWSNIVGTKTYQTSEWALPYIGEADGLGLIPDCLAGEDLTKQITRKEFAAVAVKLYESLTGQPALPAEVNPFTDCDDPEVAKAVNIGITNGTSSDKFSPDVVLNREQLATMLTRVYKKAVLPGWTLKTDGDFAAQFSAMFTRPEPFADDAAISDFAKDSVYFMKAMNIINGVGGNMFAPQHGTTAEEASDYGLATREQALKIAVGMVNNLK